MAHPPQLQVRSLVPMTNVVATHFLSERNDSFTLHYLTAFAPDCKSYRSRFLNQVFLLDGGGRTYCTNNK